MTLNQHGKYCLYVFLYAISANDILTSQLDYLYKKDLVDYQLNLKGDVKKRHGMAGHTLTDLGVYTAAHYFPKFDNWDNIINSLGI